jgi:hypothetical protein
VKLQLHCVRRVSQAAVTWHLLVHYDTTCVQSTYTFNSASNQGVIQHVPHVSCVPPGKILRRTNICQLSNTPGLAGAQRFQPLTRTGNSLADGFRDDCTGCPSRFRFRFRFRYQGRDLMTQLTAGLSIGCV